jgi:hypothetical protein
MELIYTKRLATDEDNKLFIGAFAVETKDREYVPQHAHSQEAKGFVRIQLARSSRESAFWTLLFPRKEMRAKYMHKFMTWAEDQDFQGMGIDQIVARLQLGHDRAWVIGKENF